MLQLENDKERKIREETARTKGLAEIATWEKIIIFNAEQERKELVVQFGLPATATWRDVVKANDKKIGSMSRW